MPAASPTRPVLSQEVQLLCKSKSKGMRPKDRADADLVLPVPGDQRRAWLRNALRLTSPGHPWIPAL